MKDEQRHPENYMYGYNVCACDTMQYAYACVLIQQSVCFSTRSYPYFRLLIACTVIFRTHLPSNRRALFYIYYNRFVCQTIFPYMDVVTAALLYKS